LALGFDGAANLAGAFSVRLESVRLQYTSTRKRETCTDAMFPVKVKMLYAAPERGMANVTIIERMD